MRASRSDAVSEATKALVARWHDDVWNLRREHTIEEMKSHTKQ